jgi:ATP-dependent RNA helicase DeaD
METFRIEVGSVHGIKPGNIVGAIANESGIEGVHIGRVDIREDHSYVDLPEGMPKPIFKELQKVRVAGRELRISRVSEKPPKPPRATIGRHPGASLREVRHVKPKITARRRTKD